MMGIVLGTPKYARVVGLHVTSNDTTFWMPYRYEMIYRTPPEFRHLLGRGFHEVSHILRREKRTYRFVWNIPI